ARERLVSWPVDRARPGRAISKAATLAGDDNLRSCDVRAFLRRHTVLTSAQLWSSNVGGRNSYLLRWRFADAGVGAASATRLSWRLRTLHRHRDRCYRNFLRRL